MNQKQIEKWEATRVKGKSRFILINGILNWGVLTALLWSALMSYTSEKSFISYFTIAIIAFPIGGILFGYFTWKVAEKKYQKTMDSKQQSNQSPEVDA